jgi:hypothetical protein
VQLSLLINNVLTSAQKDNKGKKIRVSRGKKRAFTTPFDEKMNFSRF